MSAIKPAIKYGPIAAVVVAIIAAVHLTAPAGKGTWVCPAVGPCMLLPAQ